MNITSRIIHSVIAGRSDLEDDLIKQVNQLLSAGAQTVILGCTELSVINHDTRLSSIIDPLDVICNKIMGDKV